MVPRLRRVQGARVRLELHRLPVAGDGDPLRLPEGEREDEGVRAHAQRDALRHRSRHLLHPRELPSRGRVRVPEVLRPYMGAAFMPYTKLLQANKVFEKAQKAKLKAAAQKRKAAGGKDAAPKKPKKEAKPAAA